MEQQDILRTLMLTTSIAIFSTALEQDSESVPWAVAGASVTAYLSGIDEIHLA